MLTIERVKELAKQNYNRGGDVIVECYEDYQIRDLIDNGIDTEKKLLNFFAKQYEIDEEYSKAADYYAYGTTEKDEIKQMLHDDSVSETECKRKCKECAKFFRNPHDLCYLAEMDEVDYDTDACDDFIEYGEDEEYTSATDRDYSPSNPWDAPGMSIKDFI